MTVVLSGVAADTTNVSPVPRLVDGSFDYLPIPERGRDETTEGLTYADWRMPTEGTTADGYVDNLYPRGDDSLCVSGDDVSDWPLHHDPNFGALTYGERRPAYVNRLCPLGTGDAVVFYTGVRSEGAMHRYVVGYLVVEEVVYAWEMPDDEARDALLSHPENAHTKRLEATGEVDDNLVVVDANEGSVLDGAHRISRRGDNGHYYLREGIADALPGGEDGGAYLGGVKQAHSFDVSVDRFLDVVRRPG